MADVHQQLPVLNTFAELAQALETGGVGGDHAIEGLAGRGGWEELLRVQKREFFRHTIFIPADDLFALFLQRERKAELRTDAVTVGSNVAGDANGPAAA